MTLQIPGRGPLTDDEAKNLFMLLLEDDLEDSPWMIMGSLQYAATSDFFQSLRDFAGRQDPPWFVSGITPILYRWPGHPRKRQLAPDIFVAFVTDRPRTSFDAELEGVFPPFVLEVVSPSSVDRDEVEKRTAYEMLGVKEYALFTPFADRPSRLEGYRRTAGGKFEPWPRDERGRLWSDLLGLYLLAQGTTIRGATRDGLLLPTLSEAIEARRAAEAENERLRQEIERMRR